MRNRFTRMFDLQHPVMLAPMGGVSGGDLAAAVSNAGGLGMVGGGYGDPKWMEAELDKVAGQTGRPWGVGLITWRATRRVVDLALSYEPHVVFFSFGDAAGHAERVKKQGCTLVCQVQNVQGAREARTMGADLIVAQGTEAGGHGAARATLPLVPAVIDAVDPVPVLAAGGIADGRGLAAALALGACGAVVGTRYCATPEALMHPDAVQRLVEAGGDQTRRTRVFDVVRGYDWPAPYTGRALKNGFVEQWEGREQALRNDTEAAHQYAESQQRGDFDQALVWAGENVDLITSLEGAGPLTRRISEEADACLRGLAQGL